ncbi:hypothetical protein [Sphingobium quisquiliarum]|nr:hypothetical protein [Sphingobium quisquiliarum]
MALLPFPVVSARFRPISGGLPAFFGGLIALSLTGAMVANLRK